MAQLLVGLGGETDTVSDFWEGGRRKTEKQGGIDLTDVCKIRFLMARSRTPRLVLLLAAAPPRPGGLAATLGGKHGRDACLSHHGTEQDFKFDHHLRRRVLYHIDAPASA